MFIIQMTGLSGAGKSTLAHAIKIALAEKSIAVEVIDGDMYRKTLCKDLGFTAADRRENIRRLAKLAITHQQMGVLTIIAAINPYEDVRKELQEELGAKTVWIHCALDILIQRDTKGLYRRALLGEDNPEKLKNLTGINDPYEIPVQPDLIVKTHEADLETSVQQLLAYVLSLYQVNNQW